MNLPHLKTQDASYTPPGAIETNPQSRAPTVSAAPQLINPRSGLGSQSDKMATVGFQQVSLTASQVETLYQASWAAQKFIRVPVSYTHLTLPTKA